MSLAKWKTFIRRCLIQRIQGEEFQELADLLIEQHRIPTSAIINLLLSCRTSFCPAKDPLIPAYVHAMVTSGLLSISDVLLGLVSLWNQPEYREKEETQPGACSEPDTPIVLQLTSLATSADHEEEVDATKKSIVLASRWLGAMIQWISRRDPEDTSLAIMTFVDAIGSLLAAIASGTPGMEVLQDRINIQPREALKDTLQHSIPTFMNTSMQLANRLDLIQKHFGLFDGAPTVNPSESSGTKPHMDVMTFEASILDHAISHARASLLLYLNAMLSVRPIIDDHKMTSFLNARYVGDYVSLFIDLVVATFDSVIAASARKDSPLNLKIHHSFLLNKLPPLLLLISESSLEALSPEHCLSQAFHQLQWTDSAEYSGLIDSSLQTLSTDGFREKFLLSCVLHRVIPESSVVNIIGVSPSKRPQTHGLYSKPDLINQLRTNHSGIERLVREINSLDGNAGIVVDAVVEVMHKYCRNKETLPLKELCNCIVRNSETIDIMAIFHTPAYILNPLCSLLENWKWDDLHGESQPVYDEFGSILLLIMTLKHRLNLSIIELGLTNPFSFIHQLCEQDCNEEDLNALDETMKSHLGEWIHALFSAEGLSDELTSSCSPQEFYRLVPTLLGQSVMACESGKLSLESLKSGLEYLLEPSLLPSLVFALQWLSRQLWQASGSTESNVLVQLLQTLTKSPTSSEAKAIHLTILRNVADLRRVLESVVQNARTSPNTRITALLNTLKSLDTPNYFFSVKLEELEAWSKTEAGLLNTLTHDFVALLEWSTTPSPTMPPPCFNPCHLTASIQLYGAFTVLHTLLDNLAPYHSTPAYPHAIDLLASLICAEHTTAPIPCPTGLSLRDALQLLCADLPIILNADPSDPSRAESIIRLRRRVDAQLLVSTHPSTADGLLSDINMTMPMDLSQLTGLDSTDVGTADNADGDVDAETLKNAAAAQPEDLDKMLDAAAKETGGGEMGMSFGDGGGVSAGVGDDDGMEDIFAELDDAADLGIGEGDWDGEGMF